MIKVIEKKVISVLDLLRLKKTKEQKMKETFQKEYLRRAPLVLQSKLNSSNKIKAINTWAVSLMSYGAGIIGWKEGEHMQTDDNEQIFKP